MIMKGNIDPRLNPEYVECCIFWNVWLASVDHPVVSTFAVNWLKIATAKINTNGTVNKAYTKFETPFICFHLFFIFSPTAHSVPSYRYGRLLISSQRKLLKK
jgi:hypothetical protein